MSAREILLDTDIGTDVDDALALALILAVPEKLALAAVTTVAGDTAVRARVASRLLAAGGRPDIEVCAGAGEALARSSFHWAGHEEGAIAAGPDAADACVVRSAIRQRAWRAGVCESDRHGERLWPGRFVGAIF